MAKLPGKDDILKWIRDNPNASGKREIARAFKLKGAAKIELKSLLKDMKAEGLITRDRRRHSDPTQLPSVAVLRIEAVDPQGDVFALPEIWDGDGDPPRILILAKPGQSALGIGDRVLTRLERIEGAEDHAYLGRPIKKIGTGPQTILAIFRVTESGGRLQSIEKKSADREFVVPRGETGGATDGELVSAEKIEGRNSSGFRARVVDRLGDPSAARSVSLIAVHQHGIEVEFPADAVAEAASAEPLQPGARTDLRDLPLLTIDPADARDHDDAVCACPDDDPQNEGGFVVWVAIADVAHYVSPGTALDRAARRRGNSTYFPDRVVPMLPEVLSAGLCSLHEGEDRACLAVRMVLASDGTKRSHRFERGIMRSRASLTYEQAQSVEDGAPEGVAADLQGDIRWLFNAYRCAAQARERRAPLHLDLPERKIILSDEGEVLSVGFRARFDAHRLIEEFMILANVAAAQTLDRRRRPVVYRVHEEPDLAKLDALREVAQSCGLTFPKGQVIKTAHFNRLLDSAAGSDFAELINMTVLRSQTQAYYSIENFGHFGLNLAKYAHFTSPIRRYADLLVHRSLIDAHGWGDDGLPPDEVERLADTASHISQTERLSMVAERDTADRYLARYLADRVGNSFAGRISGVASFGVFVRLEETGADGLVPISSLGREFFHFDRDAQTLTGEHSGRVISIGQQAKVRLAEAVPVTGGLLFELLEIEGAGLPRAPSRKGRGGPPSRKIRARAKARRKR